MAKGQGGLLPTSESSPSRFRRGRSRLAAIAGFTSCSGAQPRQEVPWRGGAAPGLSRLTGCLVPPQKDFTVREELQQQDVERWLGFITFLCEVFGTMRSSTGEPFRVLVCPIYTCLREVSRGPA